MQFVGGIVALIVGVMIGEGMRRWLNRLGYRLGPEKDEIDEIDETALAAPGVRWWIPLVLGLSWAVTAYLMVGSLDDLPSIAHFGGWLGFIVVGVWLAAVDLDVQRLPDVGQLGLAGIALVAGILVTWGDPMTLLIALGYALGCGGAFLVIHLISRGAMGFGDVKLAATCGWWLGLVSLTAVFTGLVAACLLAIAYSLITRSRQFAFGPWLIAGAVLAGWGTLL
ncbi:MAG: A24 family peptidase [Propionibacteriaceae bacterium]|jgi:leader peptidase (prepilin peptidase)/N-methyltransferase|nr:A24 family peptidase [Propionibacteriaceae bacterium]